MKWITTIMLIVALGGCINSQKKAARKIDQLIERFPGVIDTIVKVDTVIKYITIEKVLHDTIRISKAYAAIDTILINGGVDTIIIEKIRYKLQAQCTAENLFDPIAIDSLGVKLRINYKGNSQIVYLMAEERQITKSTSGILDFYEPPLTKNEWFWAFVAAATCFLLSLYINITK